MKQIAQVKIGGQIFYIENDAQVRLEKYLTSLRNYYGSGTEGLEIVADVEARIGELLSDKSAATRKVVNLDDVLVVIATIGEVEDFDSEHLYNEETHQKSRNMKRRRIFRDPDNRKLGGVCAGLAAYFGLQALWVRLAFALIGAFSGTTVVIYILLWFMVPEAQTTSEKIEMRGEDINLGNIERTIKDEFNKFRRDVGF